MATKKIYLACPYTFDPDVSFIVTNNYAAKLMKEGHIVFSPVSHSHPIADALPPELRLDHEFWMKQDLPFIDWADEVYVIMLGKDGGNLIKESKGVMREMQYAAEKNKPISIVYENSDYRSR